MLSYLPLSASGASLPETATADVDDVGIHRTNIVDVNCQAFPPSRKIVGQEDIAAGNQSFNLDALPSRRPSQRQSVDAEYTSGVLHYGGWVREFVLRDEAVPLLQDNDHFLSGQVRTQAAVRAGTKGDMPGTRRIQVHGASAFVLTRITVRHRQR